jgi:methylated-DNA-[protein]-cysteine S-methyltransferase
METAVAWTSEVPGPWSPIHVAVSAHGVVAVAWLTTADEVVASLSERLHGHVVPLADDPDGPQRDLVAQAAEALADVLAGREPEAFPVDLRDRPAWDRAVLAEVRRIPRGQTAGYGEIARRIGRPGAARAVGGAVGRNPITLLIPCHRVIAGDGTLGGYGGDGWGGREERLAIKRSLLLREGVTVRTRPD